MEISDKEEDDSEEEMAGKIDLPALDEDSE